MTDAALSFRGPVRIGLAALVVLLAGLGLWATQATLSGAIVLAGQVEVQDSRQIVQHPDGGVVAEVLVRDGVSVAAGDPLLRLDGLGLLSDQRILQGRLTELTARAARLVAERDGLAVLRFPDDLQDSALPAEEVAAQIDGQSRLFAARQATIEQAAALLARRADQVRAQGQGIAAQQVALDEQLALVRLQLASQQDLFDRGLAVQDAVLALRREAARLAGQIGELAAARARTEEQITEIDIQISALQTRRREEAAAELREIEPEILETREALRALGARIDRLEIRAPVAGVVLGLQMAKPQMVLRAAEPVLTIVPQDQPLVVTVQVPPQHIDAVKVGQSAELVLSTQSGASGPRLQARVTMLGADTLTDPRSGAAYYVARLSLAPEAALTLRDRPLLPGMRVEVYLLTGARTPLAYLLEPFTRFFLRALREGQAPP